MSKVFGLAVCVALMLSQQASATFIGVSGDGVIDESVMTVTDESVTSTVQTGFSEVQGFTLISNLAVDGGFIAGGTTVNSYMIFLNKPATGPALNTFATWTFSNPILGIMSDVDGTLEANSTPYLGKAGAVYGAPYSNRGLEGNDSYSFSGNELRLRMQVSQPGDWIRVITAVPEPSTMILCGLGMIGLPLLRRRAK